MKSRIYSFFFINLLGLALCFQYVLANPGNTSDSVKARKVKDIIIYEDTLFYAAFPSAIRKPDGEFLIAFRRAPNRKVFGENRVTHTDPNSYLVMVRSSDGEIWTKEPELIYAHPFGGSQDPCLLQLRDGTLLCVSYAWCLIQPDGIKNLAQPVRVSSGFAFLGGYILRSTDGGKTWHGPFLPPPMSEELFLTPFGEQIPAYNRGALFEGKNGRIYWAVAVSDRKSPVKQSNYLLFSDDKGLTWKELGLIATDEKGSFNEASVYETPKGDIVAFLRTADMNDQACIARSTNGGKTFVWQPMGFQGHPLNVLRLPDNRVLLTYGYRQKPFGIRARILNAECTDFATAGEIILRDDGGSTDIGYSWPVLLDKNKILVVYYFNKNDGLRHIAGTIIEIVL